jgi:enoyl-CoA hydratase/carnithine racemase
MGIVKEVAPNKDAALKVGIDIANRIAACGPLGIKATLKAAHLGINDSADAAAYATLEAEYVRLYSSQDFLEGRKAETENRPPSSTVDKRGNTNRACHKAPDPRWRRCVL